MLTIYHEKHAQSRHETREERRYWVTTIRYEFAAFVPLWESCTLEPRTRSEETSPKHRFPA